MHKTSPKIVDCKFERYGIVRKRDKWLTLIVKSILLAVLSTQLSDCIAQTIWNKIPPLEGGKVNCILFAKSKLFAGTDVGIFVSPDTAKTWHYSDNPSIYQSVSSLTSYGDTIVANRCGILSISFDAGVTWVQTTLNFDSYLRGIWIDSTGIFAGSFRGFRGLKYSPDFGKTWQTFSSLSENVSSVIKRNNVLYVACSSGVLKQNPADQTWQPLNSGLGNFKWGVDFLTIHNDSLYAQMGDGNSFYKYSDEISMWVQITPPQFIPYTSSHRFFPSDDALFLTDINR